MRSCGDCGEPEQRRTDPSGKALVNLDPVSGLCIPRLVKRSKGGKPMPDPEYDWKIEQAGRDE